MMQIQQMQDEGATEDEIKEFLATNTPDKASLLERATAVSTATKEADQTLKEEHQRLRSLVPDEAEGDTDQEG